MNAFAKTAPAPKLACYHCGDTVTTKFSIREDSGTEREFCCEGCRTAYRIISAGGLDGYYRYREDFGPRPDRSDDQERDLYNLQEEKIRADKDGHKRITMRVEGIHCASCVWLNEKVLTALDGVIGAEVRLGTARALIKFDPERISLAEIAAGVAALGYRLIPMDDHGSPNSGDEARDLLTRMGVAGFFAGNMMLISVALYAGYFDSMDRLTRNTLHLVSFLFAAPVLLYSAGVFFRGAWNALRYRIAGMDLLIAAGISIAFTYSVYSALQEQDEVYFDSITFVVFAVLTGRFLESRLRLRGLQHVENLRAAGGQAVYLQDQNFDPQARENKKEDPRQPILAADVKAGQIVQVPANVPLPADGKLLSSHAELDESMLTGEYRPVPRNKGDVLLSGARPVGQPLYLKATRDHGESTLARLHGLVESGLGDHSRGERLAATAARWFVAFVLFAAAATFAYWFWQGQPGRGIHATIALLIVACPCALSLAIPIARVVALNTARRDGCLLKNGSALETLARAQVLVFDKTGTLTGGRPRVGRIQNKQTGYSDTSLLKLARDLQTMAGARHPVAEAFRGAITAQSKDSSGKTDSTNTSVVPGPLNAAEFIPGRGVRGSDKDNTYLLGSFSWMREHRVVEPDDQPHEPGLLPVYLARANQKTPGAFELMAVFYLVDELRPHAQETVQHLARQRQTVLLTGDLARNARSVADQLGIDEIYAEHTPVQKQEYIQAIGRKANVCMIGDGINDAAALAAADCGISFADAAEISLYSADVLLLNNDLRQVSNLFDLARRTRRKIIQNLVLSFGYNLILIPLACMGAIVPVLGAGFMALSSLSVVANSLLLGRNQQG